MPWIDQLQSANWSEASCVALGAYLLGCFTTGYYLVRLRTGRDIRELGSGSVGAKNVGRFLGWTGFGVALLGDFSKGAFAVWAAQHFTKDERLVQLSQLAVAFALLFASAWAVLRRTVLPGLFAFACLPLVSLYLEPGHAQAVGMSLLAGLILISHRKNLMEEISLLIERRHVQPKHHPPDL